MDGLSICGRAAADYDLSMLWISIACWSVALLALVYDAAGNAVARRIGPLNYAANVSALPLPKLAISAIAPWAGYVSLMLAAFFAFEFFGLAALLIAWFVGFRAAFVIWARGVDDYRIEIRDFVPTRWIHLLIGSGLAVASVAAALAAL